MNRRSKPSYPQWVLLLLVILWFDPVLAWSAEASKALRIIILFDVSGSMRHNDPQRLSVAAAQLFVDLAQPQDAVGLVSFSDRGIPLVPLRTLAEPTNRTLLHTRLRTLKFTGQTTDLAAALEAGLAGLPPDPDKAHRDLVLLLTDGQLDLGPRRRSEEPALLTHIRQVILPQYRQRGIGLHTIAFTAEADQAFLQEITQATGGEFRFIDDAAILHKAFSQFFIVAHQSDSFPLDHAHFVIDKSVQDVSLVFAKREPRERIGLVTPQHEVAHADNVPPGMTWNSTPAYDRVQITHPEPGTWQIERPAGVQEGVAIVASSPLSLQVELSPTYQEAGEPISIRAFLQDKGQPVREAEQVQQLTMRAEMTTPQRSTLPIMLTPQSAGVFVATLPPLQGAGQYSLVVTAASPTLQRQRTLSFTLHPHCFQTTVASTAPVTVQLLLSAACPPFEALAVEAEHTTDNQATARLALRSPRAGVFEATMPPLAPGQTGQLTLHVHARPTGAEPFSIVKGPWPLPVTVPAPSPLPTPRPLPAAPAVSWHAAAAGAVRKLLAFNGLLVLVGGIGYGLYRYHTHRKKVPNARNADVGSHALGGGIPPQ
jgi:Mg-chelatase subunit ChlD